MTSHVRSIAKKLLLARQTRTQLEATEIGEEVTTLADAFAIHSLVMEELGEVGAFKTGNTPQGVRILAPIPASNVRQTEATFASAELIQVGIELEIAFRLEKPLPALDDPHFDEKLKSAVVAYPAIEVVDTRLAFLDVCHPMMKLADNQANTGLVYGAPVVNWDGLNLADPAHKFSVGTKTVSEGIGVVPDGSAFEILKDFVHIVGDHCGGLQVGQFVTTGALSGLHWTEKGKFVSGEIDGLGSVGVLLGA